MACATLAGCDKLIEKEQHFDPMPTGVTSLAPGKATFRYGDATDQTLQLRVGAAACQSQTAAKAICIYAIPSSSEGQLEIQGLFFSSFLLKSGQPDPGGSIIPTPFEIETDFEGYRPAWGDCRQTLQTRRDGFDKNPNRTLASIQETVRCDAPISSLASDEDAVVTETTSPAMIPAQSHIVVTSAGLYPLEPVLRARLQEFSGWVRVGEACQPTGDTRPQGMFEVSRTETAELNRYEFSIDGNLLQPQSPHVELLVRPKISEGRFGLAGLEVQTLSSGRRQSLKMPDSRSTAITPTRYYRATSTPLNGRGAIRVLDDFVEASDLGTCPAETIKITSLYTPPRGPVRAGDVIDIDVGFSAPVSASRAAIRLETGREDRLATLVEGSGTTTLRFRYVAVRGDSTPVLDVFSAEALAAADTDLAGAAIPSRSVDLRLPIGDAQGSLFNSGVQVDAR